MNAFTTDLFSSIQPIYQRILAHPFLLGLQDGKLSEDRFQFYVIQDAHYLKDFGRGLAILAAKSPKDEWMEMFAEHAKNAIVVERMLHEGFLKDWNLSLEDVNNVAVAPNTLLYTSYLMRIAYERDFSEILGAFLPCYQIYWEVGKELIRTGSPNPLYQKWIATYGGEEFGGLVQKVLEITDEVTQELPQSKKQIILGHYQMTSRFEYLFWDMGYKKQEWEI
jgi:thiaminase (transcriptional activator TenA)